LITGASSGLGRAIALAYAAPQTRLLLTGRNEKRLAEVKKLCEKKEAEVVTQKIDVCDQQAMHDWIVQQDQISPIELVIANAGVSTQGQKETAASLKKMVDVNVHGVINTVVPLIEPMEKRGRGQIALISSLASFKGYAGRGMYGGTKAAVRLYGEGLRDQLADKGVQVSVVCPGFIVTPMTATNTFYMPFLLQPERAAVIVKEGLAKNKSRIAFPLPLYLIAWAMGMVSPKISEWVAKKLSFDQGDKEAER